MSTSLLYHGFGICGHRYQRTNYEDGGVVFTITKDRDELRCAACGCDQVKLRGATERRQPSFSWCRSPALWRDASRAG